jgi:hypothetical protein
MLQTPRVKYANHIGAQLDACPHLGKLTGPFQQLNGPTRAGTRQRGSHSPDATTGNQNLFFHGDIVSRKPPA